MNIQRFIIKLLARLVIEFFSLSNKPIFKVSGLTGFELLKVNSYVTAGSFYAFKNNNDIFSTCLYVWTDMVK